MLTLRERGLEQRPLAEASRRNGAGKAALVVGVRLHLMLDRRDEDEADAATILEEPARIEIDEPHVAFPRHIAISAWRRASSPGTMTSFPFTVALSQARNAMQPPVTSLAANRFAIVDPQ